MSVRPPIGRVEVWFTHNAATVRQDYTCSAAAASLLRTPGRREVGLNLKLTDGRDERGEPVLRALYADVAWVVTRPAERESRKKAKDEEIEMSDDERRESAGTVVVSGGETGQRTVLDLRGHALEVAAAHYRENPAVDDADEHWLRERITGDAVALERYLRTGEAYRRPRSSLRPETGGAA